MEEIPATSAAIRRLRAAIEQCDESVFLEIYGDDEGDRVQLNESGDPWLHLLLERGMLSAAHAVMPFCDVVAPDENGTTPLMVAAARGYADCCAQLLSTDAYVNHPSVLEALTLAVENQHANVCRLLISFDRAGATTKFFEAISQDAICDVTTLLSAGISADSKIESCKLVQFAVHEAVTRPSIMRALLRNGANINAKDSNGRTPLSLAAARGDMLMCDLLLDEEAAYDQKDMRGRSPMFHACANEKESVILRFLQLGDSVDTTDKLRRTPLFFHAERGNVSGCRLLLRHNANFFHKDASQWTALHVAASLGYKNVCRLLVTEVESATVTAPRLQGDCDGQDDVLCKAMAGPTAWIAVAPATLLRIYGDLIALGAKAVQSKYGTLLIRDFALTTLLHLAVLHAEDAQCAYLLRCLQSIGGVPVSTQNCNRESALDLAKQRGHAISIDVLTTLADAEELGSFRVQLGGTISRSVGFAPNGSAAIATAPAFTECSRPRLAQLCRGIESGVYACADDIMGQIDSERGDTVLHFFIRDFCERPGSFPSMENQQEALLAPRWLGRDTRVLRVFLAKRNWEGKTPLHVAAEMGAFGFCTALIKRGARAGEECSVVDKRLVDPPNESTHLWKAINFSVAQTSDSAAAEVTISERAHEAWNQRERVVEYLLSQPDALPTHESAFSDLRSKIYGQFPRLLPQFLAKMDNVWRTDDCIDAKKLYVKFMAQSYNSSRDVDADNHADQATATANRMQPPDQSGIALHKIFLETETDGVHVLAKYCVNQCVIESTGDTLLHLVAAHGHSSALGMLRYLVTEGAMDVNRRNKQFKTPLHVACEHQDSADICLFLLSNGADATASCQNIKTADVGPWFTPLYCALWSATPSYEIVEMLLTVPMAIVEPRNPRLGRSDAPLRGGGVASAAGVKWNDVLLRRLVEVHPGALPLFLDHYAVEVNHLNGGTLYHFAEVRHICQHLDLVLRPTTTLAKIYHKYSPAPCVTHPVVRNAIHLKWKLFGLRCHRKQLSLYVVMLVFFYLANVVLPKLDIILNNDGSATSTVKYTWLDFESTIDYAVAVSKASCWVLAVYHLIYVELYLEWRADHGRYWRSLWNLLDVGTYILVLATIPMEFFNDEWRVMRECLLGLLSVLLCVNLMQALLVSSFFSVLIFTFARMCRVVAQFFFHYLLLLVGFAGGFHLLLHGYGPHVNFLSTMRVVFLAMFGELNYSRNFYAADASPARNICGFVLLVLYVVVVMIVALNLLTALMTSEYEHVRSQAEERALLELAGALHRFEQWLGNDVVTKLYDQPRGAALLQACERRIPTQETRHRGGLVNRSSFHGLERWKRLTRHRGRADLQSLVTATSADATARNGASLAPAAAMDGMADALMAEFSRRMTEETAALRVEMAARLQELQDTVTTMAARAALPQTVHSHSPSHLLGRSASARDVAHVDAKLDALMALLHAQNQPSRRDSTNSDMAASNALV